MLEFLRFWKFSRNCLAGDESPPGGSSVYASFGGSGRGSAWRPGWLNRQAARGHFSCFGVFWNSGLNLIGGKAVGD